MNNLLQRWLLLAPREQWLTYAGPWRWWACSICLYWAIR